MKRIALLLTLVSSLAANAAVGYDNEKNVVNLQTSMLAKGVDVGWIEIHSKKHIEIGGSAYDRTSSKSIELCGIEPSLGILILDGKLNFEKRPPKVTDVAKFQNSSWDGAAYVHRYVLKDADAMDLLDLLLEYKQVGFAISSKCPEFKGVQPGQIVLDFDTRGLDRALNRLK